jgi:23S rRNA pseudouridine955/2504/2580 synthase
LGEVEGEEGMSEHKVEDKDTDIRLDRWIKRYYPQITHGLLEKALRKGDVRVNGKKAKTADRLVAGQVIKIFDKLAETEIREKPTKTASNAGNISPEDIIMMQQSVLFKNGEVIVINKPPGLAVQGGTGISKSVDSMLDALRFDAGERPKLVHRLDKDTSGVLVLARNARSATKLMKEFSGKTADKTYWALVKGVPDSTEGKIDMPLSKQEEGDHEKVAVDEDDGKRAITFFKVLDRLSSTMAWVELKPITGRTHQLRVHMAEIGTPIIGDGKYGGRDAFIDGMGLSNKLHLHARRIVIEGMLDVTAPLPRHMQESWKKLGLEE